MKKKIITNFFLIFSRTQYEAIKGGLCLAVDEYGLNDDDEKNLKYCFNNFAENFCYSVYVPL